MRNMKTILSIILITCSLVIGSAQTKTQNTTDMEKEILNLSEKVWKAMQSENFETTIQNISPEAVFDNATETSDKELFIVKGATHIETYWKHEYVKQIAEKLTDFSERIWRDKPD